jgi:esterase
MVLHFRQYGAGPPLIILHGLLGSLNNWHSLAGKLSEHFCVYTVDQRNHGGSPHSDVFTYSAMTDDLEEFMVSGEIQRAHFLGHSMGGKTAMHMALTRHERVDRLIVVDVAPRAYEGSHDELMDAMEMVDLSAYASREEIDGVLSFQVPDRAVRQFLLTNLKRGEKGDLRWKVNLRALQVNLPHILGAQTEGHPFLGQALFLAGERSGYVTDQDMREIPRLFPKASFHTIKGAGHWVHADAPEEFLAAVLRFLS